MSDEAPAAPEVGAPTSTPMRARILIAIATYATPALALVLGLSAVQAVLGPGFDNQKLLQDAFVAEQGPWWVAVLVVGTVGVIVPPPSLIGRISVLLLVPALAAAHLMTWGVSPLVSVDSSSAAPTVLWAAGWLVTAAIPVAMVVGLVRLRVLDRRWWIGVAVATVVVAVTTLAVNWNRLVPMVGASSSFGYIDTSQQPVMVDPTVRVDDRCSGREDLVLRAVRSTLPWPVTSSQDNGDVVDGACIGPVLGVATAYDQVVAELPEALARNGYTVTERGGDETNTVFTGTAAGVPFEIWVTGFSDSDGTVVSLTSGQTYAAGSG